METRQKCLFFGTLQTIKFSSKQINRDEIKRKHTFRTVKTKQNILKEWQNKAALHRLSERRHMRLCFFSRIIIRRNFNWKTILYDIVLVSGMGCLRLNFFYSSDHNWFMHNNDSIRFNGENLIFEHLAKNLNICIEQIWELICVLWFENAKTSEKKL